MSNFVLLLYGAGSRARGAKSPISTPSVISRFEAVGGESNLKQHRTG
jgi:hypothetical protein